MKKLMTMIAAVATAFGLFADEPQTYDGTSFESAEGVTELKWTPASGYPAGVWSTTIEDALDLGAYETEGPAYEYPSTTPRRDGSSVSEVRQFAGGSANANYLKLDTGSATVDRKVADGQFFFDQVIKFTGFEDMQTNFVDGTKIALWTSAIEPEEAEGEEGTEGYVPAVPADTNLYVAVGTGTDSTNVKIDVSLLADEFDFNAWHRVTIKNADKVSGNYLGFFIWIDGKMATIASDEREYFKGQVTEFKSYYEKGQLFISMDGTSETATTVANIGFQGVGSLDDVVVDAQGPAFAVLTVDVTFAELDAATIEKVVDEDKNEFTDFTNPISVKPGQLTVTLTAKPDWILKNATKIVDTKDAVGGKITITLTEEDAVEAVAKITDGAEKNVLVAEAELLEKVAQVQNGDTITILKECIVTNGVEETPLYTFTPGTTVAVAAITDGSKWTINVAKWTPEGGVEPEDGELKVNVGVAPEKQITVTFEEGEGKLKFQGTIGGAGRIGSVLDVTNGSFTLSDNITVGEDATLKFAKIAGEKKITLSDGAKVYSKQKLTVADIFTNENVTDPEEKTGDFYVYQLTTAPTTFKVTVDTEIENGKVTVNRDEAAAGETVTITATPNEGYKLDTITTNEAELAKGETTFVMPAENVTVSATFTAIEYTITFTTDRGTKPEAIKYTVTSNFPIKLPTIELPGATFKGWTNETYTSAITELAKPATLGDIALVAEWEQLTGEPAKVLSNDVEGEIPADKKDQATANATALVAAKGDAAGVATWVATVYGEGGKIPAEKIANASTENVQLAIAFDVPVMVEPTISAPVVAEATEGPAAFEFAIKDGTTEVEIKALTDNVKKIVKYATALGGTNTFAPAQDTEVAIKLEEGKIKAEFVSGPAAGFMKADFTK